MTFFFDACLSKRIVKVLQDLDVEAIALEDEFGDSAVADTEWLRVASEKRWVVVTSDERIRRNPVEREVFEQSGLVTVFVYDGYAKQGLFQQAAWMIAHWKAIDQATARARPGTSFHANCNGKVMEWSEYEDERKRKRQRK